MQRLLRSCLDGAYMRYTTIQTGLTMLHNLVTKRGQSLKKHATAEWINPRSPWSPSVYLDGEERWDHAVHCLCECRSTPRQVVLRTTMPHTSSSYRIQTIAKGMAVTTVTSDLNKNSKKISFTLSDTIIMDDLSASDMIPFNEIQLTSCFQWS